MTDFPTRRRRRARVTACLVVLLLLAAGAATLLVVRRQEKPAPTVAGWSAMVATIAGDGAPGTRDGAARQARFHDPFGVAVDRAGNVYLTDAGEGNRVRKLAPDGTVTTLAGGREGYADGAGAAASFNSPSGLAADEEGNLYVADTGNNRIRKITPDGSVTTLAGDGTAGFRDGPAHEAQFDAPLGLALDGQGNVYVADTYNDRIRLITTDGQVKTLAGTGRPGYKDGPAAEAQLDTPCAVAVNQRGEVFIADTGNDAVRRLTPAGEVVTLYARPPGQEGVPDKPVGLALTHDGFLYVTEYERGRVLQLTPDGRSHVIAGTGSGFADGPAQGAARFNHPAGLAADRRGALYVADGANYLVRKVVAAWTARAGETHAAGAVQQSGDVLPRLSPDALGINSLPWPLDPQGERHEVVATMGEVRGSFDSDDGRHHLHSGIDVFGPYNQTARAVFDEKVTSPLCNWGFDELNEGFRVGVFSYIHMRVGRGERGEMLQGAPQFSPVRDEAGKVTRVRVRRGARFRVGDALGTLNRMYHVHLNVGPPAAEVNPLAFPFVGFGDHVAPRIAPGGIQLFAESGARLEEKRGGRLLVPRGRLRVVVDAHDQVDGNAARRRLGLYRLGYQLLRADGSPAPGFDEPRITHDFSRLPPAREAVKLAYADASGITTYGSKETRFLYEATNLVRDGQARADHWDTTSLPSGDYVLRIHAADFAGNVATVNRDLPITLE